MKHIIMILITSTLLISNPCIADQEQVERVGGQYVVSDIAQNNDGSFTIKFENKVKTGKFDILVLNSEHVHHQLTKGQELKLSAEVVSTHKNKSTVSQVLLFLPHNQSVIPVWLLSKNFKSSDLNATKFIEMHAPQNDYQIF